ncbi:MAG: hypothetical protein QOI08_2202, partial [Actinomycetota bacterium]|nr:hypothetical protein [Actinomycetota bacterium]
NAHLIAGAAKLRAGFALDAGCGHGSETLWLAARGWHVTAVDFSRATAGDRGSDPLVTTRTASPPTHATGSLARPDVFDTDRQRQGRAIGTSADPNMMIIVEGDDLEAPRPAEQVPRTHFNLSAGEEPRPVA